MTRVISMRGRKGVVPEGAVYVGRTVARAGLGQSPFHNPFKLDALNDPRLPLVLALFAGHLQDNPALVARIRKELPGRVLACWCGEFADGDPVRCHAQILARVADGGEP